MKKVEDHEVYTDYVYEDYEDYDWLIDILNYYDKSNEKNKIDKEVLTVIKKENILSKMNKFFGNKYIIQKWVIDIYF